MSEFKIISVEQKHLDVLEKMIIEFAKYENMLDLCECTKEKLKHSLLNNESTRAFLLQEGEEIVGYMIYFYTFSSFYASKGIYLEDIYIRKNFRKKGYGRAVFKFLAQLCKKEKLKRLDWSCLEDNVLGINFYESLEAEYLKRWRKYRLSGVNLEKLCALC